MRTFKYDFCCILVNRLCQLICKIIESICWVVVVAMQYCRLSALLQKYAPTACFWLFLLVAACHHCCHLFLFTRSSLLVFLIQTGLCWCTLLFLQKEAAAPAAGARQTDSSCSNSFIKMQYFLLIFLHFLYIFGQFSTIFKILATGTPVVQCLCCGRYNPSSILKDFISFHTF